MDNSIARILRKANLKFRNMAWPHAVLVAVICIMPFVACLPARGAVTCDGTNVWIGAASGGSWKNPANWRAMSAKGYSAEELFQRYTVYDLRGLAAGAVLTNDYSGGNAYNLDNSTGQTFVYGLVASGEPGDVWTVVPGANVGAIRFCAPSTIDVEGGTLDFRTPLAGSSTYPIMTPTKRGSGAFRLGVANTYLWESSWTTAAGTTVLSTNYNLIAFKFTQANGGRLLVTPPGMSRVCCITASSGSNADATARVEIERGATLDLSSGFNTFSGTWYGDIAGAGELRLSGGGNYVFAKGKKTAPLSLTGTYRLTNADLAFGTATTPNPPSSSAALAADASGFAKFFGDQTLRAISGAGAGGGVVWPANRTLTVAGAGETNVFSARLVGGAFTYAAPRGRLTLAGANGHTGPTTVAAGTLAVRRPTRTAERLLPAPLAHWTFDEAVVRNGEVVFPDSGTHGWNLVSVPTNANGKLLHVVTSASVDADGHVTRFAATSNANTAVRLQTGVRLTDALADGSSFTISLRSGRSSNGVFLIFGDGTASGSVRLSHAGCPRYPAWFAGTSTAWGNNDALITYTMSPANWTQLTLVYDAAAKTLTRYLDGVRQATKTATVNLKPRDLVLAAQTRDATTGALGGHRQNLHFDDLRIYDTALDDEQVVALCRDVRGASAAAEPIPSASPVTVAAGATLAVEAGGEVALGKLAGPGTVEVAAGATFSCADLTGFTGRIVCYGQVNLTEAQWAARDRGDFTFEYIPTEYLRNVSPDSVYCTSLPDDVRFYSTLYTKSWNSYAAKDAYRIDAQGRRPFGYCSSSVTQAVGCAEVVAARDGTATATWTMRPVRELPDLNQFSVTLLLTVRDFAGGEGRVIVDGTVRTLTEAIMSNKTFTNPKRVEVSDKTGRTCLILEPQQDCSLLIQDNRSGGWGENISLRFSVYAPAGGWAVGADYVQAFRLSHPEAHLEVKPFGYKTLKADDEWIPLAATYADSAPGSVLDFSSFQGTTADAGAYGRVVVRNGRFEFENLPGVAQRFFGANLTEDASCPDKATVGRCCAQLRRMGYNAVRIHHHEKRLVAGGSDLAATNLSATAMDKFDALVAACLTNGLYLTTDLYVSRSPISWRAVGYDRDGSLAADDFKYLVYADERVFANFCDFTRNYFSHVNPYTGRSLAAEPAMLGINLINEGNKSYFANPKSLLTNYPVWKPKWEAWLAAKKRSEPGVYGALSVEPPANLTATAEGAAFAQFLRETEESLFDRLKALLRNELGCRAPLTNLNGGGSDKTAAYFLPRTERYDYADYHRYIDHPSFVETSWALPARTGNTNPLTDARAGMPSLLDLRIPGKPFTLTEWNYSGPSVHRSMGGLFYGAIHALQDHDGIFRFAWSQGKGGVENPEGKSAGGFFDIVGDPLGRASERIAALLFMRGDLRPLQKSYVYRYTDRVASAALADNPGGSATGEERHWAGWYAKLGSVVGAAVPAGAIEAGVWPNAAKTKAQVWADLGIVPPADGSLPPAGDGQVMVDRSFGSLAVSTPKTAAFFVPKGAGVAGPLVAQVGEKSATVCAAAMDGEPLVRSARVLFFHLTECGNTGEEFSDDRQQIVMKWGGRPSLMRAGKAEVELTFEDGRYRTVWTLNEDGTPRREVPSWWQGAKLRFIADVAAEPTQASYQYEIRVTRPLGTHVIIR